MTMWLKAGAALRKAIGNLVGLVLPSYTAPTQPAFLAYNAADVLNQTGNGAVAAVPFGTEIYDRAGNFASNALTAPTTGIYDLATSVRVNEVPAAATTFLLDIVTSNRTYRLTVVLAAGTTTACTFQNVVVGADMDVGDTATVNITIQGGAGDTADIGGAATLTYTRFSGRLAA